MGVMAPQITSLAIVYSTVYSDADQRKHKSSASLAFVWGIHQGPVNSPRKSPVTRKMFPFDDVIMVTTLLRYVNYDLIYDQSKSLVHGKVIITKADTGRRLLRKEQGYIVDLIQLKFVHFSRMHKKLITNIHNLEFTIEYLIYRPFPNQEIFQISPSAMLSPLWSRESWAKSHTIRSCINYISSNRAIYWA